MKKLLNLLGVLLLGASGGATLVSCKKSNLDAGILKDVIKNTDLEIIENDEAETILEKAILKNLKLDRNEVEVKDITITSAKIGAKPNSVKYWGEDVTVTFLAEHISELFRKLTKKFDEFKNNILKDFLLDEIWRIKWETIKDSDNDDDNWKAYGDFLSKMGQFLENQEKYKTKFVDYIKKKYFNKFVDFDLKIELGEITLENQDYKNSFLNFFENKTAKTFLNLANDNKASEEMFNIIFRNDLDDPQSIDKLEKVYFNEANMKAWNEEYSELKDEYLKNEFKISNNVLKEVKKNEHYQNADALIKVKTKHLKIKVRENDNNYAIELKDGIFLTAIYSATKDKTKRSRLLSEFTAKGLIKDFRNAFGMEKSEGVYPEFGSDQDYLFNITDQEYIKELNKNKDNIEGKKVH